MIYQKTLKQSFCLEGKGLHTGLVSKVTFHPAPENHGYQIRRIDLPDMPVINAVAENVVESSRCTIIEENGVSISSIEHAIAALYACEIDNCLIDVSATEFPALDGSSILYVSKIKEVGVQQQEAPRKYIDISKKKTRVIDKGTGASLILVPGDSLQIKVEITYNSFLLRKQSAVLSNISDFAREFAASRTFVFMKDIKPLLDKGLIKGGNLDNAIVIHDTPIDQKDFDELADLTGAKQRDAKKIGYIMNKPLLYPNEPARHKLLDLIGDLALAGGFIKGTIVAVCPGHKINSVFVKAIRKNFLAETRKKNSRQTLKEKEALII
ncbi:UDP-3-O-[3-hydroxymyristoyl] N-acetylglucosamine deacetylase [Dysgonomonas sp. 216]|uniref:UDP-3-O-acyl-N-acetylglucosamine deacetylase n=1 Tax=Dysgonomonas sp. 216 TaxID=2302934 RepID=UPI0013CF6360|nr:UDP-3-O-acyl-N-acetylglucosamine deacetylase [Dysgonomonas sp. 216]NDW17571.1 UDP-3-O-[3-hydroxymyristoyl] N-acetylglucosamine deacetylase [Dysgonomonas sp. 216]